MAAHFGYIELADNMGWMSSQTAIITFGVATLLEIFGYYIPFVDNLLDVIAAPAAAICGTLLMGFTIVEMGPFIKWPISVIAGGGIAAAVQSGTSVARAISSTFTAGLGNPILSIIEAVIAAVLSVVSILLRVVAGVFVLWLVFKLYSLRAKKNKRAV